MLLVAAGLSNAAIIFSTDPTPGSLENLNFAGSIDANNVAAEVGNTGVVGFFGSSVGIENQGTGQANIIETEAPIENPITFTIPGFGFSIFEGNLQLGGQPPDGATYVVLVQGTSSLEVFTATPLTAGENRFYVQGVGEQLVSVVIGVSDGASYDLFKQPRVGGVEPLGGDPDPIPEPSSLMLLGGALPVLAYVRRRASR